MPLLASRFFLLNALLGPSSDVAVAPPGSIRVLRVTRVNLFQPDAANESPIYPMCGAPGDA
jgi:hypothetical protein